MSKKVSAAKRQDLALSLFLSFTLVALSGCVSKTATSGSTSPDAGKGTTADDVIVKASQESPGPYKTVTIDGINYKQGRFAPGKAGSTLVRSLVAHDPKTLNYWAANDMSSRELSGLMFASLLSTDPSTGEVVPELAESFEALPDGVTYITKLRKGLKWSDGKPITAQDVAFTWNTIINDGYGNSSLRDITTVEGLPTKVEVVDELTNKFTTAKPFVPFIRVLGLPPAPKHIVEPIIKGKDGRKAFDGFWSLTAKPESFVTNGPFVLENYVPSQRITFKRAKQYYVVSPEKAPLPYLERITYSIIPNVDNNLLKFKGKEIDITGIRCRDAGSLVEGAKAGNYKLYDFGPSQGSTFIMFNLNQRLNPKTKKTYINAVKSAWFNDVNFRQAINHALDRKTIVANYFKGLGEPSFTAMSTSSPFFNKNLKPFEQDLEYSKSLLKKSGFTWNKEGQLLDKKGNRVEFDLLTSAGGTFYGFVANNFRTDMKKLGIKVNFQELNFNLLGDKVSTSLDWEAVLFSLSGGDPIEPNDSANVYNSSGRLHLFDQRLPDANGNIKVTDARDWEKRIDQLMIEGARQPDKTKRHAIYDEVQQILYDQVPMIFTATPKSIVAVRNTLKNYQPTPLSQETSGLHNIDEIWLAP
jgi:peptide/nickel transport system substrate-binding protein